MDLYKAFHTNKRAEQEGRKHFLDKKADVWLQIARKNNPLYKAYMSEMLTENQAFLATKTSEAEARFTEILREAAARHLLLGWSDKGIDYQDKKDLAYSLENARLLLDMQDFYSLVDGFASEMGNFRDEEVEKDAKN